MTHGSARAGPIKERKLSHGRVQGLGRRGPHASGEDGGADGRLAHRHRRVGFTDLDWLQIASVSGVAAVVSLLTSVAGLPEVAGGKSPLASSTKEE